MPRVTPPAETRVCFCHPLMKRTLLWKLETASLLFLMFFSSCGAFRMWGFFLKQQMHQKEPKAAGNHEIQPAAVLGDNEVTLRPVQHGSRAHCSSCSLPPPRMKKP